MADQRAEHHDFKCFRTCDGYDLWAAQCHCGWVSDIYLGDLGKVQAKTEYVRHQTEWLKSLAS